MALVTVLLPVFNGQAFLAAALESLVNQTFRDVEIMVIDDGSTDRSLAIAEWYQRADPRIRIFSKPNSGLVDTLNYGLCRLNSPYVARMDADDVSFRHRIEEQLEYIRLTRFDAISCGFVSIDGKNAIRDYHVPRPVSQTNEWWLPAMEPYLPHPFLFFRTESVLRIGGYRFVLHSEDADLYWRLLQVGRIDNMPELLGKYRVHANSISSADLRNARIQSVFAQLAAISYQRCKAGKGDITFNVGLKHAKELASGLESLCDAFVDQLTSEEFNYLCAASGLKLLEHAFWRPYEIEPIDVDFTKYYLNKANFVHSQNRKDAEWTVSSTYARLEKKAKAEVK